MRKLDSKQCENLNKDLHKGASSHERNRILIRDHAAAKQWLVRVIAERAVLLHRERRNALDQPASTPCEVQHENRDNLRKWRKSP